MESRCEKANSCKLYCTTVHKFFVWVLHDLKIWNRGDIIDSHTSDVLCRLLRKNNGVD